jgi:hypothetical protein
VVQHLAKKWNCHQSPVVDMLKCWHLNCQKKTLSLVSGGRF